MIKFSNFFVSQGEEFRELFYFEKSINDWCEERIKNVEYPVLIPHQEILLKYKKDSQWKRAKIIICTNDNFTAFLNNFFRLN